MGAPTWRGWWTPEFPRRRLETREFAAVPQPEDNISYAPKLTTEEARIDWSRPAFAIDRHIPDLAAATARRRLGGGGVFARRGITPEAASSWFLPRLVGMPTALEWCMTGRIFDAQEALRAGLVRSVHPQAELMEAARVRSVAR